MTEANSLRGSMHDSASVSSFSLCATTLNLSGKAITEDPSSHSSSPMPFVSPHPLPTQKEGGGTTT